MFIKKLLHRLRKLNLPNDKFAIFGSGPMGIRGIREVSDLDLVVLPELWKELAAKYPVEKQPHNEKINLAEKIDAFSRVDFEFETEELLKQADIIGGIRYVNLETSMILKKKMGREKDFKDIELIKDYLKKQRNE